MTLVAGIDSSTQSCKVVVCDAETGETVRSGSAPHPGGTEVDPEVVDSALRTAIDAAGGLDDVARHLGRRPAARHDLPRRRRARWCATPCCGTTRAPHRAAADLVDELGGPGEWAKRIGVVPVASITATKLRWLADAEPVECRCDGGGVPAARLADLASCRAPATSRTCAPTAATPAAPATSTPMAAATNRICSCWRCAAGNPQLPTVLGPNEAAGQTAAGAVLGPGAGDNAAAALGIGAGPGDCVVSLGTSGVVSAVGDAAPHDASGLVAGFADATGRQLPLVCTLNGAPVLAAVATMLGVDFDELDRLALSAPAGAEGLTLVPFFEGERSPNLPDAAGALHGVTTRNLLPANVARAGVEGLLSSMAYCMDRIAEQGVDVERVILVGGGARSEAVRRIAPADPRRAGARADARGVRRAGCRAAGGMDAVRLRCPAVVVARGDGPLHRRTNPRGGRAVPRRAGADAGAVNARRRCDELRVRNVT